MEEVKNIRDFEKEIENDISNTEKKLNIININIGEFECVEEHNNWKKLNLIEKDLYTTKETILFCICRIRSLKDSERKRSLGEDILYIWEKFNEIDSILTGEMMDYFCENIL